MSNKKYNRLKHNNDATMPKGNVLLQMTKADYISMAVLTLIFAVLVFIRLGNHSAPSSSQSFSAKENNSIIIDLGSYMSISSMDIYLGNLNQRKIALSAYNEVTKEWIVFNDKAEIKSVFRWNNVPVNYYLRYLGIVFLDDDAVINEIVCKAPDGSIIKPVNTDEYKKLFDEQSLYPDYSTYMDSTMFDEIYHGRTAYEILHGLPAYELTHPHLGKILIAGGIAVFGMNPFGWRFVVALFGIIMVPVMYIFAKRIMKNTFSATSTTALLVFEFMHFTLSRIATIDVIVALFILLMYYFMYAYLEQQDKESKYSYKMLFCSGLFLAFGVATKFTGIYAGIGLAILLLGYTFTHFPTKTWKRLLIFCTLSFIVIPLTVYVAGFFPIVEANRSSNILSKVINGTKYMCDYHTNLNATHYYSSKWYTWPVIGKPLLLTHQKVAGGKISSISVMGNPLVFWAMIPCFFFMVYRAFKKKDVKARFLMIAYLTQYVPWMPISRCLFIYHYFAASLFGILIVGYSLHLMTEKVNSTKTVVVVYLVAVIGMFMLFYPAISGKPASVEYLKKLKWFKDWVITY